MSITKQKKKRAISETVTEPVAKVVTDHSPAKKQKKVGKKLEKTETKPVNGNASKAEKSSPGETQLTAKQRKRLKTKERKLAAIAKIKEEGGVAKSIWATKKEKKSKIEAQKGVEDVGKTVEKKKKNTKETDSEDKLKAKQAKRAETMKLRKEKRAQDGQYKVEQVTLSPEEIRLRIADIKNRGELTKTARRKLAVLTKKLGVLEGTAPTTVVAKKTTEKGLSKSEKRRLRREKKTPAEGDEAEAEKEEEDPNVEKPVDIQTFEKKKQKKVVKKEVAAVVKGGAKKPAKVDQKLAVAVNKPTGKKGKKATPVSVIANEEEEEEEEDDEEDEESDDESEADQEDEEMEASSDEEEEAEENGVNSSIQETEEDDEEEEEEEEDDDDDDDEEDDEDEEEEKAEVVTKAKAPAAVKGSKEEAGGKKQKQKQEKGKNLKETSNGEQNSQKKKRYVLFVGNVPFDAKPDEIKTHFLTKVEKVTSVRIPTKPGTQVPRGIAYVEVLNDIDYEKGLSLHHSFLKGRRINVEYTMAGSKQVVNRQELVSKNQKLHAMRKAGQLAGSQKHDQKRSVRRFKKREQEGKTKQD